MKQTRHSVNMWHDWYTLSQFALQQFSGNAIAFNTDLPFILSHLQGAVTVATSDITFISSCFILFLSSDWTEVKGNLEFLEEDIIYKDIKMCKDFVLLYVFVFSLTYTNTRLLYTVSHFYSKPKNLIFSLAPATDAPEES